MPKMRVMSWVLFTLSLAFFFVQDFRWALELPMELQSKWEGSIITGEKLQALAERAKQSRDAQSLAFVALHTFGDQDIALADQAVAIDPSLTWIYYTMAHHHHWGPAGNEWKQPAFAPTLKSWIAKLQASDPQNALPYLLEAEILRERTRDFPNLSPPFTPEKGAAVSQQGDWVAAMEKAYSAPRYDSYNVRRFNLERKVMLANGWGRPDTLVLYTAAYPIPNLLNIRSYANYKVFYLAPQAEAEKHHEEALRQYYSTALYGQRMQVEGGTVLEHLMGAAVDRIAAEPLEAALRKGGQNDQAELVAFSFRLLRRDHPGAGHGDPLAISSNQFWAGLLAIIFAFLTVFLWGAVLLCALYLNAKRWIRVQKRGRIFQFVTGVINYLAVLVFLSSLVLFLVNVPYFANLRYYMDATGEVRNLEPVIDNVYPYFFESMRSSELDWSDYLLHPVHHYLHWAAAGLVLLALVGWLKKRFGTAPAPPVAAK